MKYLTMVYRNTQSINLVIISEISLGKHAVTRELITKTQQINEELTNGIIKHGINPVISSELSLGK
jgi:hypothetical protein